MTIYLFNAGFVQDPVDEDLPGVYPQEMKIIVQFADKNIDKDIF